MDKTVLCSTTVFNLGGNLNSMSSKHMQLTHSKSDRTR
jgi:hypothetical protein